MGQAWRANVLGEIKKESYFDARKRIPTTMDGIKECGSYQRPRQTRETESRRARTRNKTRLGIIEILNVLFLEVSILARYELSAWHY